MQFTQKHIDLAFAYITELNRVKQSCFQHIAKNDIAIGSTDSENDTLHIRDCSVQIREVDTVAIVPRKKPVYVPFVPYVAYSFGEPDDVDIAERGVEFPHEPVHRYEQS